MYTIEYINDSDYIKIVDGVEYLIDITDNIETDNPYNLVRDFITYEFIRRDHAIIVHDRIYDVCNIHRWIISQGQDKTDFLRIPISSTDEARIIQKYHEVETRLINFADNIMRGDIFLLSDGSCKFSYTWYYAGFPYKYVYGTNDMNILGATCIIDSNDIIGYVLKTEDRYNHYAEQIYSNLGSN